jgi:CRISPR-associated protein Csd1
MMEQLVALAESLRQNKPKGEYIHDALDNVPVSIDCVIDRKGKFKRFIQHEPKSTVAEAITAKKGKARLVVDRTEELLGYGKNARAKHQLFLKKLKEYSHLPVLSPVLAFYGANKPNGIRKARSAFPNQVEDKLRTGNIAFMLDDDKNRLHEQREVRKAIISKYEAAQAKLKSERLPRCSVCSSTEYAIVDLPHGMIKRVPDGQTSGCALVSYNDKAYESYDLRGNENSTICTHCARAYVDALNWLLGNGERVKDKEGKEFFRYRNRRKISDDTAVVFWLRKALQVDDLSLLDEPDEGRIHEMIDSVFSGRELGVRKADTDKFYAITLSGAAARIAVRDWIETSLLALRTNLADWFQDIEISQYDPETKAVSKQFPRFSTLVWNVKGKGSNDVQHGRVGAALWKCALTGTSPPLWMMGSVLNRIRIEQSVKPEEGRKRSPWEIKLPARIAILKLCLNRKADQQGGIKYMATLDESNKNIAYVCGRLFAVLESIQYHASGGNLNAGIRERFFSFASTMPSTAFGRLMKLSQHHLSKIRGDNPGLAVNLDKKLQELMCRIEGTGFPSVFSLEDQGSFAIGYYHQRQKTFDTKSDNKEN